MSVTATTCEQCGRTVYLALDAHGKTRAFELLEHTYRIDGSRVIPCVGVYVDHASRCPGDILSEPAPLEVRR